MNHLWKPHVLLLFLFQGIFPSQVYGSFLRENGQATAPAKCSISSPSPKIRRAVPYLANHRRITSVNFRQPIISLSTHKSSSNPSGVGSFSSVASRFRGGATHPSIPGNAAPPLKTWIGPALSCGLSYALYNLFIKRASSFMDPMLGGVLLQCVAALLGAMLWLVTRVTSSSSSTLAITRAGATWSVAAGLAVGLAEILSFVISSRGVPAMQSIPIVVGGSVAFGTALARLWLGERLSARGWIGVLLITTGIALVGMDPSNSSSAH